MKDKKGGYSSAVLLRFIQQVSKKAERQFFQQLDPLKKGTISEEQLLHLLQTHDVTVLDSAHLSAIRSFFSVEDDPDFNYVEFFAIARALEEN